MKKIFTCLLIIVSLNALGQSDCGYKQKYLALLHLTHFMKNDEKIIKKEGKKVYQKVLAEFIESNRDIHGESLPYSNSWLGSGLMNFDSPFEETQDMRKGQFDKYKNESKTDTVKGWIRYYQKEEYVNGHPIDRSGDIFYYNAKYTTELVERKIQCIAIYQKVNPFQINGNGIQLYHNQPNTYVSTNVSPGYILIKILVKGKEFDLSKEYQFIPDDKIIKQDL